MEGSNGSEAVRGQACAYREALPMMREYVMVMCLCILGLVLGMIWGVVL